MNRLFNHYGAENDQGRFISKLVDTHGMDEVVKFAKETNADWNDVLAVVTKAVSARICENILLHGLNTRKAEKARQAKQIPVVRVFAVEGPLAQYASEDGPIYCFDTFIHFQGANGKTYCKNDSVAGAIQDEDGFFHPNYDYKNEVAKLQFELSQAFKVIDLDNPHHVEGRCDQWYLVPPPLSLEEVLAEEAVREQEARQYGSNDERFEKFWAKLNE